MTLSKYSVENNYTISILMNGGITYTSTGESLREAFEGLNLDYRSVKTKGEITVSHGDKKASRLIALPKLRRYFMSKLMMSGLIGNFETLLR